jgi:glutathione S-transferase
MGIKLYGTKPSPPAHSVRLMLESKGLDYKPIWLLPGLHPALLRTRGFRGGTVPAIKIDGHRVQRSLAIARALDELQPDPPLLPSDPEQRREVEEAERWADEVLQDVPRRIIRWMSVHRPETRVMIAREIGVPLPRFAAWINAPTARRMANKVDSDAEVENAIATVPEALDHVDALISKGTIGGEQPNAADFQIATNVRALMSVRDLDVVTRGRPATDLAMRLIPEFGNDFPAGLLPAEMLRGRASARPD